MTVSVGDDQDITLSPDDAITAPMDVPHRFFNAGKEDVVFEVTMRPAHEGFEKSLYLMYGLGERCVDGQGLEAEVVCAPLPRDEHG